jgi:4'-phosphopantetheinyl transferase
MLDAIKIIAIKLDYNFDFEKYLCWFDKTTVDKINQYVFKRERIIATVSHMLKQYYLANLLGAFHDIAYDVHCRPYIVDNKVDFNITHSGDYIVCIVSTKYRVGIDIEYIKSMDIDMHLLNQLVFSTHEQKIINNLSDFFIMWTKKESLIKNIGCGFGDDYYQKTTINLNNLQYVDNYVIYCQPIFDNYHIAVCLCYNA